MLCRLKDFVRERRSKSELSHLDYPVDRVAHMWAETVKKLGRTRGLPR